MKGGGGAPTRFPPSPAGASGKHNRLDSGHQPYSPGSLFGVLWRQSGAPGQNPCRLQGSPRDPLGVQQCPPEVPPPGRPLVGAGGPVLAPCHRASWNLTPSPQSHTQAPWPTKPPICAPSHDLSHDCRPGCGTESTEPGPGQARPSILYSIREALVGPHILQQNLDSRLGGMGSLSSLVPRLAQGDAVWGGGCMNAEREPCEPSSAHAGPGGAPVSLFC